MQCFITRWNSEKRVENMTRSGVFFDEPQGVSSDWWNTVLNAWYYFSNKMILEGEIKDAKMSSFSSDFQTLVKHQFSLFFSLWIIKINKPKVNLNILFPKRHTLHFFNCSFCWWANQQTKVNFNVYHPKSLCLSFFKECFFFQHFRDAPPLNTVSGLLDLSLFWLLLVTGSLILFVWTLGNKLLVIFHTQVNLFSIAGPV